MRVFGRYLVLIYTTTRNLQILTAAEFTIVIDARFIENLSPLLLLLEL